MDLTQNRVAELIRGPAAGPASLQAVYSVQRLGARRGAGPRGADSCRPGENAGIKVGRPAAPLPARPSEKAASRARPGGPAHGIPCISRPRESAYLAANGNPTAHGAPPRQAACGRSARDARER